MPARAGRRDFWHDTERLSRDLDRPARGLAASETFQAETGPADNDALTTTNGDLAVGCVRVAKPLSHAFARLTLKLSSERVK